MKSLTARTATTRAHAPRLFFSQCSRSGHHHVAALASYNTHHSWNSAAIVPEDPEHVTSRAGGWDPNQQATHTHTVTHIQIEPLDPPQICQASAIPKPRHIWT